MMEEADALERTAEWRLRRVDAEPADTVSREAALLLEKLAAEIRQLNGTRLSREFGAICNWLGESGEIADFMDMAQDYRARIGVDCWPVNGEAHLQALVNLAKRNFGAV